MGGRLNLDGETLNLDGATRPPRPPYNLSTDSAVYERISETETYDTAVELLETTFAKICSPIFARYVLKSC